MLALAADDAVPYEPTKGPGYLMWTTDGTYTMDGRSENNIYVSVFCDALRSKYLNCIIYCHVLNKGATDRLLDVMSNVHLGVGNPYNYRERSNLKLRVEICPNCTK